MDNRPIPIIILNWNGIEDTLECLDSLTYQTYENFEIYLVDNNSSDNSVEILKQKVKVIPNLNLIVNQENIGFTRGNNEVMRKILSSDLISPYIILLNNDTIQDKNWLKNIIQSAKDNSAHIVSSKMIDYYNRALMDNAGHFMLNTGEIISIGHQAPIEEYNNPFENIGACGGAALYSTDMLKDIGVFDEYFDTGYEDAELGLRAFIAGYKCWYEPSAIVYHKMGQSIKKVFRQEYVEKIFKNTWYTYFANIPLGALLINAPFFILKHLLSILFLFLLGKKEYAQSLINSFIDTINESSKIVTKRKRSQKNVSSIKILKKQKFFLFYDIQRVVNIFFFRKRELFEKYVE